MWTISNFQRMYFAITNFVPRPWQTMSVIRCILQSKSIIILIFPSFLSVTCSRQINAHNSLQLPIRQSKSLFQRLFLQKTWDSAYEHEWKLARGWLQPFGCWQFWFGRCWCRWQYTWSFWRSRCLKLQTIINIFYFEETIWIRFLNLSEPEFRKFGNIIVRFINFLGNECFLPYFSLQLCQKQYSSTCVFEVLLKS